MNYGVNSAMNFKESTMAHNGLAKTMINERRRATIFWIQKHYAQFAFSDWF